MKRFYMDGKPAIARARPQGPRRWIGYCGTTEEGVSYGLCIYAPYPRRHEHRSAKAARDCAARQISVVAKPASQGFQDEVP